jgi:predicted NUDIX family phosphoesterase
MGKMDEQILVAPRTEIYENEKLTFQGVNSDKKMLKQIVNNIANTFSVMRRGDAEENPDFKQPIPYCVIKRGNQVYVYERLQGGGETRLHSLLSLGVGGHMNKFETDDFYEQLSVNLERELNEELIIDGERLSLETIGLINDDENEVGKVHIGLLVIAELEENANVSVRETDQLKGEWINIQDLPYADTYERLESWSKFVSDILVKDI